MRLLLYWLALPCVAPLVGAWIEITTGIPEN